MRLLINQPATLYTPEKATAVAAALQSDDSDWTYTAVHDPLGTGYSYVAVYDEDGSLIAKFSERE